MAKIITFSITLEPETSLDDAQRIRDEMLQTVRRHVRWHGQDKVIVGSSLDVDAEKEAAHD